MHLPYNVIHIQSPLTPPLHSAQEVYLDGRRLLLTEDGLDITYGHDEPTVVTLRVMPAEVHFGHGEP